MRDRQEAGDLGLLGSGAGCAQTAVQHPVYPQTPHHAELLGGRPQREACIFRSGGDPGEPAPGQGPAGEVLTLPVLLQQPLASKPGAITWMVRAQLSHEEAQAGPQGASKEPHFLAEQ